MHKDAHERTEATPAGAGEDLPQGLALGYDNTHAYHHRHWFGTIEAVSFSSYEEQLERFQQEWAELMQSIRRT